MRANEPCDEDEICRHDGNVDEARCVKIDQKRRQRHRHRRWKQFVKNPPNANHQDDHHACRQPNYRRHINMRQFLSQMSKTPIRKRSHKKRHAKLQPRLNRIMRKRRILIAKRRIRDEKRRQEQKVVTSNRHEYERWQKSQRHLQIINGAFATLLRQIVKPRWIQTIECPNAL